MVRTCLHDTTRHGFDGALVIEVRGALAPLAPASADAARYRNLAALSVATLPKDERIGERVFTATMGAPLTNEDGAAPVAYIRSRFAHLVGDQRSACLAHVAM